MKKIIMDVEGMHCPSCGILIQESLEELNGVNNVNVFNNKVTIDFDETKVSQDKIKIIIKKEGYEVK